MTRFPLTLAALLLFTTSSCAHFPKPTTRPAAHDPSGVLLQDKARLDGAATRFDGVFNALDRKLPGDADVATGRAVTQDVREVAGDIGGAVVTVGALVKDNGDQRARADRAEAKARDAHANDWRWLIGAGILAAAVGAGMMATSYPLLKSIGVGLLAGGFVAVLCGAAVTLFMSAFAPVAPYIAAAVGVVIVGILIDQYIRFRKRQAVRDRANRELVMTYAAAQAVMPPDQRAQADRMATAIQSPPTQKLIREIKADPTLPDVGTLASAVPANASLDAGQVQVNADTAVVSAGAVTGQ